MQITLADDLAADVQTTADRSFNGDAATVVDAAVRFYLNLRDSSLDMYAQLLGDAASAASPTVTVLPDKPQSPLKSVSEIAARVDVSAITKPMPMSTLDPAARDKLAETLKGAPTADQKSVPGLTIPATIDPNAVHAVEHETAELKDPTQDGVAAALAESDLLATRLPDIVRALTDLAERVAQHRAK